MITGRHFAILALLIPCALAVQVRGSNPGPSAITEQQRGEAVFLDALSIPCPGEVFVAQYNDSAAVAEIAAAHGSDLAAIIVEPVAANMGLVELPLSRRPPPR